MGIPHVGTNDVYKGQFISYLRLPDYNNNNYQGDYENSPRPNFIALEGYITPARDDFAGGQVLDSNLNPYTPSLYQTQTFPDSKVDQFDLYYFAAAYGRATDVNPYADMNADGAIGPNDVYIFSANF
jgi:hypothetical protein